MCTNVIWFLSMNYLKPLFQEPCPKENAFCISICTWICFFECERERGEAKISTLRSSNNHARPTGFESHHSCVPGWKTGQEPLPKSSYCLTAMNLGAGGSHSHRWLVNHYTWAPSLNHLSLLGAVYLDEVDFQTSEDCFYSQISLTCSPECLC